MKIVFFVTLIANSIGNNRPGKFLVFNSPASAVILKKKMSLFKNEEYALQFEYFSNEQRCRKGSLKLVIQLVPGARAAAESEKVVFDSTALKGEADVPIPAMWREVAACFRIDGNEDYKVIFIQVKAIQSLLRL